MRFLSLVLLLLGVATSATGATLEKSINVTFPDEIAGLAFQKRTEFPQKELGINLSYKRNGPLLGSIYIYNAGMKSIPAGPDSSAVRGHFAQAIGEMKQWETVGKARPLGGAVGGGVTRHPGCGPQFVWQTYEMVLPEATLLSSTYLTAINNHFVKLRITHPKNDPDGTRDADKFVQQLRKILGGC